MTNNVKLYNGYEVPMLGLGTWQIRPPTVKVTLEKALDLGYRNFDCAFAYCNEKEIGEVFETEIRSGKIKREDLFVTSKLWNIFHRPELVSKGFQETLDNLKFDYLDLYIIHFPLATKPGKPYPRVPRETLELDTLFPPEAEYKDEIDDVDILETWKEMEKLVDSGKVRSIGISNFNIKQVQNILDHCRIKPAVNQIEVHIYLSNKNLVDFCLKNNVQVTAYSPLGGKFDRPTDELKPLNDPEVWKIAEKLNATPGQILISYIIHRGLICIPKSDSPSHLEDNFKATLIKLSDEDFKILDNLNKNIRVCDLPMLKLHKDYPFWED